MLAATRADSLRLTLDSVEIEPLARVRTVPGVELTHAAARNGPGTGRLRTSGPTARVLAWQAPGSSTFGEPTTILDDEEYVLEDGEDSDAYVRVDVSRAFLWPTAIEARVLLADRYHNGLAPTDVSASEALAGDVATYTITLENESNLCLSQLKVWLDAAVADLEISDDGAAWVSPTSEAAAMELPDLVAGGSDTLHLRRTIAVASSSDDAVLNHLHFRFFGL